MFASAKESNKSRFDSFSVRNSVLIISAYYLSGLSRAQPLPKQLYLHSSYYREKNQPADQLFFRVFQATRSGRGPRDTRNWEIRGKKNETHILFLGISPSRVSRAPRPVRACPRSPEKREKISPVLQAKKNLEIDARPSSLILFLLYQVWCHTIKFLDIQLLVD